METVRSSERPRIRMAILVLLLVAGPPAIAQTGGTVCTPLSDAEAQSYVSDRSQTVVKDSGIICKTDGALTQARFTVTEPSGAVRDCEVRLLGGPPFCWRQSK